MTAGVLDRPATPGDQGAASRRWALDGGATLEGLLGAALGEVRANGSSECPVCHAGMVSTRARAGAAASGAECGGCGSRLS